MDRQQQQQQSTSKASRLCNAFGLLVRQFLLILGKNFLLQFRRPIGTVVELVVPIFAVGVIMIARLLLLSFDSTAPMQECFVTFPSDPLIVHSPSSERVVYYAPNTSTEVNSLANVLRGKLSFHDNQTLLGVATQDEFDTTNINNSWCFDSRIGPGIYFENVEGTDIRYTIRMNPDQSWDTQFTGFSQIGPRTTPNVYFEEGFVHLQKLIDESIYEWKTNQSFPYTVVAKQLPYPSYERDSFLQVVDFFLTMFFVLSLIYTAGVVVKELVLEKESRVKETMKMMGLNSWVLTATWFLKQLIFLFFPVLIITLFLKYGKIYAISDAFLILVFLMFYVSAGIAFCFFISVWFTSTRIGLMAGMVAWFAFYFPYLFLSGIYNTLTLGTKIGVCLLPNTCVGFGTRVLADLETRNIGLTFSNFASPVSLDDQFHMGWVVFMLFIDTILYMSLYWYIDAVKPGKYGTPKPFYFPFLPSYWCGKSTVKAETVAELISQETRNDNAAHESEPTGMTAGISIRNLTKIYNRRNPKRRKVAVDNISLNMYEGQITALLGHNGAGKTTTMSMLTGLFTPTVGTATVDGYDITTDMDLVRHSLGICPQHNVLFDRLTVSEHLTFFALLKGLPVSKVRNEVNSMLEDLQLADIRRTQSQRLSGGMKRKLSVGIALIGGSRIVVLDEPTSGMDPYARRGTWDLLLKHKAGRTMLLTTHFMDEADLLGDRIAIMAEGQIRCSGSSLFLKSRYGVGYHMTVVKEEGCDPMAITGLIKQNITGAELVTDVGAELSFILPSTSSNQFPELFDLLHSHKRDLGLSSFGISVTTMEEVFIKVGQGEDESLLSRLQKQNEMDTHGQSRQVYAGLEENVNQTDEKPAVTQHGGEREQLEMNTTNQNTFNTGIVLWLQQFMAMLLKRFYNLIRFWMNIIWQLIIPLIFVLLSLVFAVTTATTSFGTYPSRAITIESSSLSDNRTFFFAQFESWSDLLEFEGADTSAVGITDYINYTNSVYQVIEEYVQDPVTVADCCNYKYQVLDNYCASRTSADFRSDNDDTYVCSGTSFGYNHCRTCLSCEFQFLRTCSLPVAGGEITNADGFCPSPPQLDPSGSTSGRLDDYNIYMAEKLIRLSGEELDTNDFFQRIQGGFVVTNSLPIPESAAVCMGQDTLGVNISSTLQDVPVITVWYNNQPYHMAPASINALYTLLLRKQTGMGYTITVTNNPLPLSAEDQVENANNDPYGFAISSISIFGLSFLFASFILFPIEERSSKAKHLQFVSGVQASSYWLSSYLFDMMNAMVPCIITLILFACFNINGYNGENLGAIFMLLVLTSWAAIPLTYIFSFAFSSPLVGFALLVLFHYLIATILQTIVLLIRALVSSSTADIIRYIALIHPVYALGTGLSDMYTNQVTKESCLSTQTNRDTCTLHGIEYADSIFEFSSPAIGHIFLYQFLEGILFIVITLLIEREFFIPEFRSFLKRFSHSRVASQSPSSVNTLDNDVVAEKERIQQLDQETLTNQAVVITDLHKVYKVFQSFSFVPKNAVNGINLIIPKGECFGLLGVNGAGKTTTFKMLTGDIIPTSGTALVSGYDIKTQLRQVQQRVGYCPQFDAIIDRLTGRELLTMFARLRGVPEHRISRDVENEIQRLDLVKHASKRCGTYSGGNKRKLSTAVALIGNPPIVLLDEPTTGMDPATRRFLWNALISIVREGKSVILTSHSMEECEALCTRLAIMVNGQFKCLGSLQHLKSKYGAGFTMQMRIQANIDPTQLDPQTSSRRSLRGSIKRQSSSDPGNPAQSPASPPSSGAIPSPYDTTAVKVFVNNNFTGAVLLEEHQGAVTYQIPSQGVTWSHMFRSIEQNKESLGIVDYSVSQTTLDQIFINFAKEQNFD